MCGVESDSPERDGFARREKLLSSSGSEPNIEFTENGRDRGCWRLVAAYDFASRQHPRREHGVRFCRLARPGSPPTWWVLPP